MFVKTKMGRILEFINKSWNFKLLNRIGENPSFLEENLKFIHFAFGIFSDFTIFGRLFLKILKFNPIPIIHPGKREKG